MQKGRGRGRGCFGTSKKDLVGIRRNSDFELFQKIESQDGTCHGSLQKTESKMFSLKLDSLVRKPLEGIGKPFAPFRRGTDGLLLE
jgi:hypothetical protein